MRYKVHYLNEYGERVHTIINAYNRLHLAQLITDTVVDMKDDDSDNIISIEEL